MKILTENEKHKGRKIFFMLLHNIFNNKNLNIIKSIILKKSKVVKLL